MSRFWDMGSCHRSAGRSGNRRLRSRRGRRWWCCLWGGSVLAAPVLHAEDYADHDDHHDQKGAAILAAATCIGVPNFGQREFLLFQGAPKGADRYL
jgi:hypothetical protein